MSIACTNKIEKMHQTFGALGRNDSTNPGKQ